MKKGTKQWFVLNSLESSVCSWNTFLALHNASNSEWCYAGAFLLSLFPLIRQYLKGITRMDADTRHWPWSLSWPCTCSTAAPAAPSGRTWGPLPWLHPKHKENVIEFLRAWSWLQFMTSESSKSSRHFLRGHNLIHPLQHSFCLFNFPCMFYIPCLSAIKSTWVTINCS